VVFFAAVVIDLLFSASKNTMPGVANKRDFVALDMFVELDRRWLFQKLMPCMWDTTQRRQVKNKSSTRTGKKAPDE
jgi:hypothetical protein